MYASTNRLHGKAVPFYISSRNCPKCGRPVDHFMVEKKSKKYYITCKLCGADIAAKRYCRTCKKMVEETDVKEENSEILISCKVCKNAIDTIPENKKAS